MKHIKIPRISPAAFLVPFLLITALTASIGCQVTGYNTPAITSSTGTLGSIERIDPVNGNKLVSITTKANAQSFFGKVMSIFGKPSYTLACIVGGPDNKKVQATIDWSEAVAPVNAARNVTIRIDGANPQVSKWTASANGRETSRFVSSAYVGKHEDATTIAVRTTNNGGNLVTLLFNIEGFAEAWETIPDTCKA